MWIEEFSFSLLAVICQFIIYCFSRKCGIFRILNLRELEVNKFIFRRKLVVTSTCLISCTVFVICCSGVHCKENQLKKDCLISLMCMISSAAIESLSFSVIRIYHISFLFSYFAHLFFLSMMCDDVIQFSLPIFYLFAIHDVSIVWNVENNFVISKFFSLFSWLFRSNWQFLMSEGIN